MNFTKIQQTIITNRLKSNNIDLSKHIHLDFVSVLDKLKDLKESGQLIAKHLISNSHITFVFDYDADGLSSGAVLYNGFVNQLKHNNNSYIPNRRKDGNGINDTLYNKIQTKHNESPIDLIILSDHGSSDERNINRIVNELGIEVILTDHHTIPEHDYPKSATLFVNPERSDNDEYIPISGCFVAFLTVVSAYRECNDGIVDINVFNDLLPYVALTTISDVMSLNLPINRAVCDVGFREMNSLRNPLWLVFKKLLGIKTTLDYVSIGFGIAPLINTGNRMNVEEKPFELLITKDVSRMVVLIKELMNHSNLRKKEQKRTYVEADLQLVDTPYHNSSIVCIKTDLAIGGIIAGQIGEAYGTPTVCFVDNDNSIISGSARGILGGINLPDIFRAIQAEDESILVRFGGHKLAAGCAIHSNKLNEFKRLFNKHTPSITTKPIPIIDMDLKSSNITVSTVREIDMLKPFGKNFPSPVFRTRLKIKFIMSFGNVIKFVFKDNNRVIEGIYFNNAYKTFDPKDVKSYFRSGDSVDVICGVEFSNFAGSTTIQLKIIDVIKI